MALASSVVFAGCASAPDDVAPYASDLVDAPDSGGATVERDDAAGNAVDSGPCAALGTGCACSVEGESVKCGTRRERFGDYLRCTTLYRTCQGGVWSDCVGDRIVGGS
jgi:hypothetical protein